MRIYFTGFLYIFILVIAGLFSCQSSTNREMNDAAGIFKRYCVNCHGIDGTLMTNGARDLSISKLSLDERILVITEGRNVMSSFKNTLSSSQIKSVAEYTIQLKASKVHAE